MSPWGARPSPTRPGYREKFADNLKRDLPRIPLAATLDDFRAFRDAGKALAKLHLDYESLDPWPLKWIETPGVPLSYRVEKMKLSKDKRTLVVNDSLALEGIPPEVFDYRLGNRSALDWVIDQYQVSTDKRSGITSDPNRPKTPNTSFASSGRSFAFRSRPSRSFARCRRISAAGFIQAVG